MRRMWWLRVGILAIGTFAIGTDGFVVAGVLDDISHRTHVTVGTAGLLVTIFSWVLALSSPVIAALTGRMARRLLLLSGICVFIIGNATVAISSDYAVLAVGRAITALGAAMYLPNAVMAASLIAPEEARGRALSLVGSGITVGVVLGSPIGTYIGGLTSYQGVFWFVAGIGVLALLGLVLSLPALPSPPPVGLATRLSALRMKGVPGTLLVTLLAFLGGFTMYTYVGLLLAKTMHAGSNTLATILVVFGIGGAIGNVLGGVLVDRWGSYRTTVLCLVGSGILLCVLPWTGTTSVGAAATLFGYALFAWMTLLSQQNRLLQVAPKAGPLVISVNTSAQYLGIGAAGAVGAAAINVFGVRGVGPVGGACVLAALITYLVVAGWSSKPVEQPADATVAS